MKKDKLEYYKKLLMDHKMQILNYNSENKDDLKIHDSDLAEQGDLANSIADQHIGIELRQRNVRKLRLIDLALRRIDDGSFGCCEECDEEIESKRLEKQPWSNLCIIHAEEKEKDFGYVHAI